MMGPDILLFTVSNLSFSLSLQACSPLMFHHFPASPLYTRLFVSLPSIRTTVLHHVPPCKLQTIAALHPIVVRVARPTPDIPSTERTPTRSVPFRSPAQACRNAHIHTQPWRAALKFFTFSQFQIPQPADGRPEQITAENVKH